MSIFLKEYIFFLGPTSLISFPLPSPCAHKCELVTAVFLVCSSESMKTHNLNMYFHSPFNFITSSSVKFYVAYGGLFFYLSDICSILKKIIKSWCVFVFVVCYLSNLTIIPTVIGQEKVWYLTSIKLV